MRKIKGFSYNPETDEDVIEHINKQQNGSQYVWSLVRKDMASNDLEQIIERKIKKYLQGADLSAGGVKNSVNINELDIIKNIMEI